MRLDRIQSIFPFFELRTGIEYNYCYGCLSVCLSVHHTSDLCVKMTKRIILVLQKETTYPRLPFYPFIILSKTLNFAFFNG